MKEKSKSLFILVFGIIFWMAYLYDKDMSRYGIYTIFSYNTHEILAIIPFISILVTIIWLLYLIIKSIKEKKIKSYKLFPAIFLVLFIIQTVYIVNMGNTVTTSTVASIETINRDTMEVVINENDRKVTLECPMIVLDMLKADGTKYGVSYEWNKKNPSYGKLCIVKAIN